MAEEKKRRKINFANVREEARALLWEHRRSLAIGLVLVLINPVSGVVQPAMQKILGDRIISPHRPDLLLPLAGLAAGAMIVQAITNFSLSQVVSVAAQKAIAKMRETVQQHVL